MLVHALVRLGQLEQAEQALAGLGDQGRDHGETQIVAAGLRLARHDPRAATTVLARVLDGSAPLSRPLAWRAWPAGAFLLEAIARDALGDPAAAWRALERALDSAEPERILLPFLLYPAPGLLERHARDCARHAALVSEILSLLPAGRGEQERPGRLASPHAREDDPGRPPPRLIEPLTKGEIRVLRYLPTNLTGPEIADELYVSLNTVKSHMRALYAKLGTHHRSETVARARDLGLLAPSARSAR
jgi:LuxR family maltose regulon positive regulatory protein